MSRALGLAFLVCSLAATGQEHSSPTAPHSPNTTNSGTQHAANAIAHGEGHETSAMPNEIWWKWANFALLAGVLGWLGSKHLGPFFRARTEQIQGGIREAAAMRAESDARAAEIERRVSNLSAEVATMRERAREEIAAEGARVRAETEQQIAKVQAQAEQEIASAAKAATAGLRAHAADLAIGLAERQIRERMTGEVQDSLNAGFVDDLRRNAGRN